MHDILTNYTADQMVLLDESSKDGHTLFHQYGHAPIGETPQESMVHDQGIQYNILPALTLDGYIAICVIEGSIDGEEFFNFVLNDVVSSRLLSCQINMLLTSFQLPKMNCYPRPYSMIIQDNCSTHRSEALRDIVEAAGEVVHDLCCHLPTNFSSRMYFEISPTLFT